MSYSNQKVYKALFAFASIYDVIFGLIFIFFFKLVFETLGIPEKAVGSEPYLSLIGVFLFVIGIAYFLLFKSNLSENRNLVFIGALFKLGYFSVAVWYFALGSIPHPMFLSVFGVVDLIMFLLMMQCYIAIGNQDARSSNILVS